jgi:hypothetical protein
MRPKRVTLTDLILATIERNPGITTAQVAAACHCRREYVRAVRQRHLTVGKPDPRFERKSRKSWRKNISVDLYLELRSSTVGDDKKPSTAFP